MLTANVETGIVSRVVISGGVLGELVEGENLLTGEQWQVVRAFPGHPVVDALAPLNVPIQYTSANDTTALPVIREADVHAAFTSLDGTVQVPFIMPHEWSDPLEPDVAIFQAGGRTWSVAGRVGRIGSRAIQARVEGDHIPVLRELVLAGEGVVFLHAPCPVPLCPVPAALSGVITTGPGSVSARLDLGEMIYTVDFQERAFVRPVPALTWGDVAAGHSTWADVIAAHSSWFDVRDGN